MRGQAVVPTDAAEAVERLLEDLRIAQGNTDAAIDDYNRCLPVIAAAQEVVRHADLLVDGNHRLTSDRYRALKDALTAYEEEQ